MRVRRLRTTALALCIGAAGAADAGSFTVEPVRVTLAGTHTASALTVRNQGAEPAVIQLELASWSQHDGIDVLEPTRALLATPPVFTLQPGGSQVVRVGWRGPPPEGKQEIPFRLLLKEVPPAPTPETRGVQIALHMSLPVFVLPPGVAAAAPSLHWDARRDNALKLAAHNDGNVHVQVTNLRLTGVEPPRRFTSGYVLPGQTREWQFGDDAAVGSALHLVAQTDAGDLAADVVVTAP